MANIKLSVLLAVVILTATSANELASLPFHAQELVRNVFADLHPNEYNTTLNDATENNITRIQTTPQPLALVGPDGEPCTCVPYYFCTDKTPEQIKDFHIDIRFSPEGCTDHQEVCCKQINVTTQTIIAASISTKIVVPTCGIRNNNGIDFRITGNSDNEAEFGEFPWTVAIVQTSDDKCICAGSLIHPQVVLTGAHCTHRLQHDIKIRAGEWDTQTNKERLAYQERKVINIVQHPNFNEKTLYYNIAILKLDIPVELEEHIQPICLPEVNYVAIEKNCFATGWGKDKFGQIGNYQVIMKRVQLSIVEHGVCELALQNTTLGSRFVLHPSFVCAGGEIGKDTCEGDGGAPLVCPIPGTNNKYQQIGIVSWGIGCGDAIPAVYGNVARSRAWIDGEVTKLGFDSSLYTA